MNQSELFQQLKQAQKQTLEVSKTWQHYKGGRYTLLCVALNEKTLNPEVIYASEAGLIWARPLESFLGSVLDKNDAAVPRFRPVSG